MFFSLFVQGDSLKFNSDLILKVAAQDNDSVVTMIDGNSYQADESYEDVKLALAAEPFIELTADDAPVLVNKKGIIFAAPVNNGADSTLMLINGEELSLDEGFAALSAML